MSMRIIFLIAVVWMVSGCASDGSVDWNNVGKALEAAGEIGRQQQAEADRINQQLNAQRSNTQNTKSSQYCSNKVSEQNKPGGLRSQKLCTYKCFDGTYVTVEASFSCPIGVNI